MKRRFLSVFLAFVMVFSLFQAMTVAASAEEEKIPAESAEITEPAEEPESEPETLPDETVTVPVYNAGGEISAVSGLTFSQIDDDHLKKNGRIVREGTYLKTSGGGIGFKINVEAAAATNFELTYAATTSYEFSIIVDGDVEHYHRFFTSKTDGTDQTVSVPITAGAHTIEAILESQAYKVTTAAANTKKYHFLFKKVKLNGVITEREPDKKYFLECVGDSITGG